MRLEAASSTILLLKFADILLVLLLKFLLVFCQSAKTLKGRLGFHHSMVRAGFELNMNSVCSVQKSDRRVKELLSEDLVADEKMPPSVFDSATNPVVPYI